MNKKELSAAIAEETGLTLTDVETAVEAFVKVVTEELKKGARVQIRGFGAFETVSRQNGGEDGDAGQTPLKMAKFRPGNNLKKALKEENGD